MLYVNIGTGLFLIVIGFAVRRYPDMIAGYNTMTSQEKANVDVDGLSKHMMQGMIFMGSLLILCHLILEMLDWKAPQTMLILIVVGAITPYLALNAQQYDHNRKKDNKGIYFLISVLIVTGVFVGALTYYGTKPADISIKNKALTIDGMYGLETTIKEVTMVETLPVITMRTNGYAMGDDRKGRFRMKGGNECHLFLNGPTGPYIRIKTADDQLIYLNRAYEQETINLFNRLNLAFASS